MNNRITDGTNFMPTLDSTARPGFFKLTDGTNTAPTMDTASRAGFQKVTDGTNTLPTMDIAGRAGFIKVTDGTNTLPTMDATARRGYFTLTDGTNTAPTMDAIGRAGFQELTDGTNGPVAVKAASTAAAATDKGLVVTLSPNLPSGTSSVTMQGTAASAATAVGNPVQVGGVFNTTPTTLTTGQQGQLQLDSAQNLLIAGQGPVTAGTVATKSLLAGAQYNTTLPSPSNNQQVALQSGPKGELIVGGQAATGSAQAGNPVAIAGADSSGNIQTPRISANKGVGTFAANSDKASYNVSFNQSPTASTDLFAIESGTTKIVRIRRIVITNVGAQTTPALRSLQVLRTTAAGAGSTTTPAPYDSTDAVFSGIARTGNSGGNLGTAGTVLATIPIWVPSTAAASGPLVFEFGAMSVGTKGLTGIAGTSNGISLRDPGAAGGAGITGYVEFTEE